MALTSIVHQSNPPAKKNHSKEDTFAYGFRPIYLFSRFFGLMPFSIIYDSTGEALKPSISRLACFWLVILISIHTLMFITVFKAIEIPTGQFEYSPILYVGDAILFLMQLVCTILLFGLNIRNRFEFIDILKMFVEFDKEASQHLHEPFF